MFRAMNKTAYIVTVPLYTYRVINDSWREDPRKKKKLTMAGIGVFAAGSLTPLATKLPFETFSRSALWAFTIAFCSDSGKFFGQFAAWIPEKSSFSVVLYSCVSFSNYSSLYELFLKFYRFTLKGTIFRVEFF